MKFTYHRDPGETIGRHIAEGALTDQVEVFDMPAGRRDALLNIALQPQAGASVQIHTTLSSPVKVAQGNAVWMPSGHGEITESFDDVGGGCCTAIRLTVIGTAGYQLQI